MRLEVERLPSALYDTIEIWDYISQNSLKSADQMLLRIDEIVDMLAMQPQAGRVRAEFDEELRSFPCGNFLVFYKFNTHKLTIVRILSGYRELDLDDF